MGYSAIDSVIQAWVEKHRFTLFDRIDGHTESFRSVYLSSSEGECFQIWIDEPKAGNVTVHAADVETHNNEQQLRYDWSVPVDELRSALEEAVVQVRNWMARK